MGFFGIFLSENENNSLKKISTYEKNELLWLERRGEVVIY